MYGIRGGSSSSESGISFLLYLALGVAFIVIQQIIAHGISEENAVRAAEGSGYSDVEVTDRHTFFPGWRGCASEDWVAFEVTATDNRGEQRSFIVCDGLFKAATVRFK